VAAGSGALAIERSSDSLPTATVGTPYLQQLEAQGGVPPYNWASTITFGMTLTPEGVLYATPMQPTDGPIQFTVNVTDSIGTLASATFSILIIAPGNLTITTPYLPAASVGAEYDEPILATDGTITGVSYIWSLSSDTPLPGGLAFGAIGSPAVADISGTPTQAGDFPLVLNLADNFGHTATRQYILTVAEAPIPVPQQTLSIATIGQSYSAQLVANSISTVSWRIFTGSLPPGLTLSSIGAISGTVSSTAVPGSFSFSVAVSDLAGAESVVPLSIEVEVAAASSGGCATGSGPLGTGLLLLALTWLGAKRRRRHPLRGE
jgi:large repetitive protein